MFTPEFSCILVTNIINEIFLVSIHDKQFHKMAWSHASFKMCHSQTTPLRHQHIEHKKEAYWWQVIFFGNPCIKWVRYFIILTIIWLSGVLWTSSDHQSDPIVTKAFQNPDGNCPSIYTQSKHYLSTIGSKLHHRKTIWPNYFGSNEILILTQFYHRFTQFPPCGKPSEIQMCSNSTILFPFLER